MWPLDLVDQVLLFAATTKTKGYHYIRRLQVSEIVDYALRNTALQLHEADFTVEKQIPAELPRVDGDLSALAQCLQNLIINAMKYSDTDKAITISAGLESGGRDAGVVIRVQDRGMGISDSELTKIFEPFYRSPRVVAAQLHGTGLGL